MNNLQKNDNILFGIIISLVLLTLCTFLLVYNFVGASSYTILFITSIFVGIVIYKINDIEFLDFKNLILKLNKIKEEIYAKADVVKKLGEKSVSIGAINSTRIGYWNSALSNKELLLHKKEYSSLLKQLGSDSDTISNISAIIDKRIGQNLQNSVRDEISKIDTQWHNDNLKIIQNKLKLYTPVTRKDFEGYLNEKGKLNEGVSEALNKLDMFLNIGEL